jgi:hypothetical protein
MNDALIAFIRTVVPTLMGSLFAFLAVRGLEVPAELAVQLTLGLTAAATGAYYALVRWVAARYTWVNWLLGYNSTPHYGSVVEPEESR